ncbi:unnamed protein product [Rotaria magnacalcarata]|uniref:Uncharacterized protein n=2 Tax=Rotaria magnacalcarata TaxID=392030 RepID=A0A816D3Y1_9BILA|nr:unnamed protein product [Rotaria magnacalcarata]CAF4144367.1 unnamed protein product [Rotaria magnacalcarata]
MSVDSICLFADVSACGGSEISCKYLSTSPASINNHSFLLGCKTQIESLLLQFGKFDMPPCNIEEFHVCSNHSNITYASRFKNCCLCKPLGRSKSSNSGLRIVTKLYAFAAWKQFKFRLSFGRKMCTPCRRNLDKYYITEQIEQEYDANFQWLHDVNLVHTPSISDSNSYHVLS